MKVPMAKTVHNFRVKTNWPERTARFQANIDIAGFAEGVCAHLEAGREASEAGLKLILPVSPGKDQVLIDEEVEIPNADGWSPETPTMYWATLRCMVGDRTVAEGGTAFGFRQFEVSEGRFRVGEEWFPIRAALLGSGESPIEGELTVLEDLGFNAVVVGGHRAQAVLPIADRGGLTVLVTSGSPGVPEDGTGADGTELLCHPSFLGKESEGGVVFMDLGWDQVADLGRKGVQEVTSTYALPRSDGRPVLVRVIFPSPIEETHAADEARFAAEGLAMLRVARGVGGYCVSLRAGQSWAEHFPGDVDGATWYRSYLPIIHGLTVLVLRMNAKQFAPGERAGVAISLINPGGYTGDGALILCDVAPDKTRRTLRQPVHITKSSRSFSPVTVTAPAQRGEWEIGASLVDEGETVIGRAIPLSVEIVGR
jgi:hypothetical protein